LKRATTQGETHWTDQVREYIHEHFREPDLTLKKLSAAVGISTSAITHEFQHYLGVPVSRYILNLRLSEAKTLLHQTNLPIKLIAANVGFNDPYYFSAKFHRECNQSPDAFRRYIKQSQSEVS
jgi:AraC-like DNA-binding protein